MKPHLFPYLSRNTMEAIAVDFTKARFSLRDYAEDACQYCNTLLMDRRFIVVSNPPPKPGFILEEITHPFEEEAEQYAQAAADDAATDAADEAAEEK